MQCECEVISVNLTQFMHQKVWLATVSLMYAALVFGYSD